jgi:hypothetical protein
MGQSTLTDTSHPGISQAISGESANLIGTVSADGNSVVADRDGSVWGVVNAQALKRLKGHRVSLKYTIASENMIQVISAKAIKAETKYALNLGDAAFRR